MQDRHVILNHLGLQRYTYENTNAHMCGNIVTRPHVWITVQLSLHESYHIKAVFACHVGQGRCVVCS